MRLGTVLPQEQGMAEDNHISKRLITSSIVTVEEEITRLQSTLSLVKHQQSLLDKAIDEHRALLTPFRQLPDDILGEIFIWCLPNDYSYNAMMTAREPPVLLGRVCSRWRSLAYRSPRLWTTLHLSSPIPPAEYTWNSITTWVPGETRERIIRDFDYLFYVHCNAIQDWFERSCSLPLSITIDLETDVKNQALLRYNRTQTYFDILLSSSARWRTLQLAIPTWLYPNFLATFRSHSFPLLEFLHVSFCHKYRSPSYFKDWKDSGLFSSKNLRVLHFCRNPFRLSDLGVDCAKITHLNLCARGHAHHLIDTGKVGLMDAYTTFRACKNLQQCSIEIADAYGEFSPSNVAYLPLLHTLTIMDGALSMDKLIQHILVPSLRHITYYSRLLPSTTRRSPLLTLLRQSDIVESLTTSLDFFTVDDLVECFNLLPHLNTLTNWYFWLPLKPTSQQKLWKNAQKPFQKRMMKAILGFLLPNGLGACPCPNLQVLTLKHSLGLTDQDALEFLQERLAAPVLKRLSMVHIQFDGRMSVDIPAKLQPYVDDGLNIKVVYPPIQELNHLVGFHPRNGLIENIWSPD